MENKASNEEIVNDIMNKFHIQGDTVENTNSAVNEAIAGDETASSPPNSPLEQPTIGDVNSNDEVEKNKPDFIEDIDDETLRNMEESMSESDKEKNRQAALELKTDGNKEFNCKNYIDSINLYTKALNLCPSCYEEDRSIYYCNRAAAKMQLNYTETAVEDCTKAIQLNPNYMKAYLRRAKLFETLDKLDESLNDFKKIVELDPSNGEAKAALVRLPPRINERNEKLKEEMLGEYS